MYRCFLCRGGAVNGEVKSSFYFSNTPGYSRRKGASLPPLGRAPEGYAVHIRENLVGLSVMLLGNNTTAGEPTKAATVLEKRYFNCSLRSICNLSL